MPAQEGLEAVYGELSTFGGKVAHAEICYYIVFALVCGKGHVQCIKCGVELAPCLHPVPHVEHQFYLIFAFAQADLFFHVRQPVFLLGVPRLGGKGHYARLLRIAVYVYMDVGLFLLYRRVDLYLLEIGVRGSFDVEVAQNAVPVGLCAVGPGMRALDFGWYGAGGIVNAYLYMVAAGCQGRQAIAVRCIDMSQRADAVPVYPESTGLCTFHEEYQAFPFHLYGNFNIFFIFYDAGVGISPCQLGGYIGGMPAVSQLVFIRRTGQCAVP